MLRSFHDGNVVSYEVQCEQRIIVLRVRATDQTIHTVTFSGVEGYHFEHDAFGNIIDALEQVPFEQILSDQAAQIEESFRLSGSPGPWAHDLAIARATFSSQGVHGFVLSSSYGMSGWLLAREVVMA